MPIKSKLDDSLHIGDTIIPDPNVPVEYVCVELQKVPYPQAALSVSYKGIPSGELKVAKRNGAWGVAK